MNSSESIEKAIKIGRNRAKDIIKFRKIELARRAEVLTTAPHPTPSVKLKKTAVTKLGPPARGVLIAEGDSWFDYPFNDILRILEDHHGYEVESVAHWGDRLEEMAYADGQLEKFTRLIEKLLRRESPPLAILLSGGGNDLAGDEFAMLLNHASSAIAGLNDSVLEGVIDKRVKIAYITVISEITEVCRNHIGQPLPIIIHGYDYPVPDGRGFLGGWWKLPGPWLEPGFRQKGFSDLNDRISLAKDLITRFNVMLSDLPNLSGFEHVHYINLRDTLSAELSDYKNDWANELHPTAKGFEKVTQKFAEVIESLS